MTFVITKKGRARTSESYRGSTWDMAGIRHLYKAQYQKRDMAESLAVTLSMNNPVGFEVHDAPTEFRKDDLIKALQAIDGNPKIIMQDMHGYPHGVTVEPIRHDDWTNYRQSDTYVVVCTDD